MTYYDEVEKLRIYVQKNFKMPSITADRLKDFREKSAKNYGAAAALEKCYDNLTHEPLYILEELCSYFQIACLQAKQKINHDFYDKAGEAVQELIDVLKGLR